jgi:hypothetical protein
MFPDAEAVVASAVRAQLVADGQAAPVGTDVPSTRPSRFVVVQRTGGVRVNLVVDGPQLSLEGWGKTSGEAERLCQRVRSIVFAMRGGVYSGVAVGRVVEVAGPANLPDPETSHERYTCTLIVHMRGSAA